MSNRHNLIYIKLFLLAVLLAGLLSLSYKTFILARDSSFKYDTFNLLVIKKEPVLFHIDTKNKKMVVRKFVHTDPKSLGRSRIEQTSFLGVLIDGTIVLESENKLLSIESNFLSEKYAIGLITNKKIKLDNINAFDVIKIYLYSRFISKNNRDYGQGISQEVFPDPSIFREKVSVQVVNASGINGLGSKIGTALRNVGYNVVSIKTEDKRKSQLLSSEDCSISCKRLENAFSLTSEKGTTNIADITLILGLDIFPY